MCARRISGVSADGVGQARAGNGLAMPDSLKMALADGPSAVATSGVAKSSPY